MSGPKLHLVPRDDEEEIPAPPAMLSSRDTFTYRVNEALSRFPRGDVTRLLIEELDFTRMHSEEQGRVKPEQHWLDQLDRILRTR